MSTNLLSALRLASLIGGSFLFVLLYRLIESGPNPNTIPFWLWVTAIAVSIGTGLGLKRHIAEQCAQATVLLFIFFALL